jgi:hypothetical protein
LLPKQPDVNSFRDDETRRKLQQKVTFDQHHKVHNLPSLKSGDHVFVRDSDGVKPGIVKQPDSTPRSYQVVMKDSVVRRNRRHLIPTDNTNDNTYTETCDNSPFADVAKSPENKFVLTRSGRHSVKPNRLDL